MKIAVYFAPGNARSVIIGKAMAAGMKLPPTDHVQLLSSRTYRRPEHDVAIFYGLADGLRMAFNEYPMWGRKAIYIDLGYWGRKKKSRFDGYHKLVLNNRHPTDYFQRIKHDNSRFASLGVEIHPWRKSGRHIIVVGMSGKGALAEGFQPHQWERETIARLRKITDRPIVFRPKPSYVEAKPIPGTTWMQREPIEEVLRNAHAVVTHHSNFAVEAILAGIPAICPIGVASVMGGRDLSEIENPPMPDGRGQWAADIAWTQWSIGEMQSGAAWRYLRSDGLV